MIKDLTLQDISQLVKLYRQELPGFLSDLGEEFLVKYYQMSLSIPEITTIIEKENEQIMGFATCCTRVKGLHKRIILADAFGFLLIFLRYFITHIEKIPKALQTVTYPGFSNETPELLTIVIDKKQQGRGLGRKLFHRVCKDIAKKGYRKFRISTYKQMKANGFYQKMGCNLERTFAFLGQEMNYYIYQIPLSLGSEKT